MNIHIEELEAKLREHKVYRLVAMCLGRRWQLQAQRLSGDPLNAEGPTLGEAMMNLEAQLKEEL